MPTGPPRTRRSACAVEQAAHTDTHEHTRAHTRIAKQVDAFRRLADTPSWQVDDDDDINNNEDEPWRLLSSQRSSAAECGRPPVEQNDGSDTHSVPSLCAGRRDVGV